MKIAFVAPFYGRKAAGGAESECRHTAAHLAQQGVQVEVLTTCLLDLNHDWNINYYAAGVSEEDGVTIRRFPADPVDASAFTRLHERVQRGNQLTARDQQKFAALFINSEKLYRYLAEVRTHYDWFVFIPYLFGTTRYGIRICAERSALIPCLHDEPYARLQTSHDLFQQARRIIYHSPAEQELAAHLYGGDAAAGRVIGEGVNTDITSDAARFRQTYAMEDPFIFYVGRKDASKNVPQLINYFVQYKSRKEPRLKLLLAGPGGLHLPEAYKKDVIDLGYIPLQDKYDACAAATALVQPSLNESFSLVLMEAWLCGTPCLVPEQCAVTARHVRDARGGLYYADYADFEAMLEFLTAQPDTARALGASGRQYVLENYEWSIVMERVLDYLRA